MYLYLLTGAAVLLSFCVNPGKTIKGLRIALRKFLGICIPLLLVLIGVSISLYVVSGETISALLTGHNSPIALLIASAAGSITMMPGFIAFPLSGILKQNQVPYLVISAFTSTLMMVGVLTFPVEKKYFGFKVALIRNIISLCIALTVAVITGIFFGEIL